MRYTILGVLLAIATLLSAQSTDRYSRVIGNATETLKATGGTLVVTIGKVQANDYRNTVGRSIDENKEMLVSELMTIGYQKNCLHEILPVGNRSSRNLNKQFRLTLNSISDLDKVLGLSQEGVSFGNIKYDFVVNSELSQQLSISAIQDAKRKAKAIASASSLEAGKILNIEDKPLSLPPSARSKDAKDSIRIDHKVAVTFDLKD